MKLVILKLSKKKFSGLDSFIGELEHAFRKAKNTNVTQPLPKIEEEILLHSFNDVHTHPDTKIKQTILPQKEKMNCRPTALMNKDTKSITKYQPYTE